ncbi:hypothetical protein DERP_008045 [Dermatophagoides pteronyssinus]|uniref:Uncharacterized protein n=2 Tax=Dermatophagoides pteronyssinus TaxID=6956 RepID=A0ABQ8JJK1_DERPT|nr:uncharacterized protein LOC113792054 [Dermatophagoides pteronyssinus]KAH9422782.1 hypothetical protein DERP_008045 [Dermatophagoides pteronyssinus]
MMANSRIVPVEVMKNFIKNIMIKLNVDPSHAENLADVLVTGDYRGHFSHGLNRIELYIKDIQQGTCKKDGIPKILKETSATAWVDGNALLGPVVGKFCMELAIKKAKESGVGWVVAKGSNHFGIAGYYSMMALSHKLLGMSFTNASPLLAPTRSTEAFFGTNPLSLSAPSSSKNDDFVLDMATSVVALGKVEIANRKEEKIPHGWVIDKNGKTSDDPANFHALLPLGGPEHSSGYKGYGLAALVEIFTSILGGSAMAPNVRSWSDNHTEANLGQCFIAINPDCFAPGFSDRMSELNHNLRTQKPADPDRPVLVHGDPERAHMQKCDQQGGIEYHINQIKMADKLAEQFEIEPLKTIDN